MSRALLPRRAQQAAVKLEEADALQKRDDESARDA